MNIEDPNSERIYYVNRTVCDILKDMRYMIKAGVTLLDSIPVTDDEYTYIWKPSKQHLLVLAGQVEELQWYANRMEASLQDVKDVRELLEERSKLKKEVFELRKQRKQLLIDKIEGN